MGDDAKMWGMFLIGAGICVVTLIIGATYYHSHANAVQEETRREMARQGFEQVSEPVAYQVVWKKVTK